MPKKIQKINKKHLSRSLILIILLSAAFACRNREYPYNIHLYKSGQGWGYDILTKDKLYIHQPYMPVIAGDVPFPQKKAAKKTAVLMIKKLKEHKVPSVSKEELQSIISN
jgi:hypothetical protein